MSNTIKQDQPMVNQSIIETDEEKFNRLMAEHGFAKKAPEEQLTGEAKFRKMVELENLLEQAKALKSPAGEKDAKRIRRMMRKIMGGAWRRQYQKLQLDAIK